MTNNIESLFKVIDPVVAKILEDALSEKEISADEGLELYNTTGIEFHLVGLVADEIRRRRVGDIVSYVDFDQLFGMSDDTNPLMILIWIVPIIIFVFYGQRIQLYITSGEIKKGIKKLDGFRSESRTELIKIGRASCRERVYAPV